MAAAAAVAAVAAANASDRLHRKLTHSISLVHEPHVLLHSLHSLALLSLGTRCVRF
jgi:hypothetical protein